MFPINISVHDDYTIYIRQINTCAHKHNENIIYTSTRIYTSHNVCILHSFVSVLQLSVSSDTSEKHLHMSSVLLEAFNVVRSELQAALHAGDGPGNSCASGTQEHEQTMHLLEKYSEQLVQMTRNKLSQIWTRISYSGSVGTEDFKKKRSEFISFSAWVTLSCFHPADSISITLHTHLMLVLQQQNILCFNSLMYINCGF